MAAEQWKRTERGVFWGCVVYLAVTSLIWLFFVISQRDGGVFFKQYNPTLETVFSILGVILVFWMGWSFLWYLLKRWLLARIGFSREELDIVFSTRHSEFELERLLDRHSERKIRILDMIGRRGRAAVMATVGFTILYFEIRRSPGPDSLTFGIQSNYLETMVYGWWMILTYHSNGYLGKVTYGAQARIMDGVLGRANCLLIGTLWGMFKFVMIPIGIQLNGIFPEDRYAALFLFIWVSYLVGDTASEIVGSLFGKQKLKVWGVGEVNRKSIEGTAACFLGSLLVCLAGVYAQDLGTPWLVLAMVVAVSNTAVELWSPRGTDDFTMATTNALLCWGFGWVLL